MLVAVRAICVATPKTVLTELVVVALLASVPEAHHALTPAVRTFHWMEDLERITGRKRTTVKDCLLKTGSNQEKRVPSKGKKPKCFPHLRCHVNQSGLPKRVVHSCVWTLSQVKEKTSADMVIFHYISPPKPYLSTQLQWSCVILPLSLSSNLQSTHPTSGLREKSKKGNNTIWTIKFKTVKTLLYKKQRHRTINYKLGWGRTNRGSFHSGLQRWRSNRESTVVK